MRVVRITAGPSTLFQEGLRMLQAEGNSTEGVQSSGLPIRGFSFGTNRNGSALQMPNVHVKENN